MKKKNSVSDFTSERNAALVANFRKNLVAQSQISIDSAIKGAAQAPAPRFWVSEQRAAVVIARMLKADLASPEASEAILQTMFEEKREMYREIYARVKALMESGPQMGMTEAVIEVINQPAPRSYMSWQRAKGVIYSESRRRRLERSAR